MPSSSTAAEMVSPIVEVLRYLYSLVPRSLRIPLEFNFIMVHYLYMIGMSIAASIILFGGHFMPYIDALFFAAGSATQSGLNTLNINELYVYQQVTFTLVACVCNPIFINTFVVFVRLYWFEKRFKHLVEEIRDQRRSRTTMSRSKSEMKNEMNPSVLEKGVAGRQITVLHETTKPNGMSGSTAKHRDAEEEFKRKLGLKSVLDSATSTSEGGEGSSRASREASKDDGNDAAVKKTSEHGSHQNPVLNRDIMFADELPSKQSDASEDASQPANNSEHPDMSKHVAFLERQQRNAREGNAIHIPGPRDFDRGEVPKHVDDTDSDELGPPPDNQALQEITSEQDREGMNTHEDTKLNGDDHTMPEHVGIRFNEQEHPGRRAEDSTFDRTQASGTGVGGISRLKSNASRLRQRRTKTNRLNLASSVERTFSTLTTIRSRDTTSQDAMPYLSWTATTGRNSAFLGLTEAQREELGGIEYRALKTLAKVLICYFIGFSIFGSIIFIPWILRTEPWSKVPRSFGVNPTWWAIFTAQSAFNDLGFTLTPNSMESFQDAVLPLLLGSFLIIIGNTGFPIMLRFTIWVTSLCTPRDSPLWEELRFLLDHPRRCFTLLFPSKATWWLFWVLVLLNGIDLIFFIILDLHDKTVTALAPGYRVLDGWFQATSTRTAGFACVNLADLHPGIQVSYMIMMYISVFPIAISVRRTNVYEEKSLGIWGGEEVSGDGDEETTYVGQHLRRQLSFDLWYIFLGFFIIAIAEGSRIENVNEPDFSMFNVLFEIVSAYGTVGLSLGYPTNDASFSAEFGVVAKLVIIAMMIRGRHRGLPYALDRAILLPSENLQKKEAEEADLRHQRRGSIYTEVNQDAGGRRGSWKNGELDESGLPRMHLGPTSSPQDDAMTAGAGGDQSPEQLKPQRRRSSGVSATNRVGKHERARSLGRVIASGLSAGPTYSKQG